jgi:hypothetical protein
MTNQKGKTRLPLQKGSGEHEDNSVGETVILSSAMEMLNDDKGC